MSECENQKTENDYLLLEVYDFENDNKISRHRKQACRLQYSEMEPHHLDKIFTSSYVYDRISGEPVARKPKSIHEFIYFIFQSLKAVTFELEEVKRQMADLKQNIDAISNPKDKSDE